jgi:hypothetical protein
MNGYDVYYELGTLRSEGLYRATHANTESRGVMYAIIDPGSFVLLILFVVTLLLLLFGIG